MGLSSFHAPHDPARSRTLGPSDALVCACRRPLVCRRGTGAASRGDLQHRRLGGEPDRAAGRVLLLPHRQQAGLCHAGRVVPLFRGGHQRRGGIARAGQPGGARGLHVCARHVYGQRHRGQRQRRRSRDLPHGPHHRDPFRPHRSLHGRESQFRSLALPAERLHVRQCAFLRVPIAPEGIHGLHQRRHPPLRRADAARKLRCARRRCPRHLQRRHELLHENRERLPGVHRRRQRGCRGSARHR